MEKSISISEFIKVMKRLPSDEPRDPASSRVWYKTQKEHWLGWLGGYDGPGAYGRKNWENRDAKFVYNHVVCPGMLLYLMRAIDVPQELIDLSEKAYLENKTEMAKSGAIRKIVPWAEIYCRIWGEKAQPTKGILSLFSKF